MVGNTGTITACEAHPRTAEYLHETVELNNLASVGFAQLAVAGAFRWLAFSDIDADYQNNVLPKGRGVVPMVRLDALFSGVPIALWKVDVEGWEKFVFLGAGQVPENVRFVYFECWDEHFRESGYSFPDIHDILLSSGLQNSSLDGGEPLPIQRDDTLPRCVNLFALRATEKFAVRMGLRA